MIFNLGSGGGNCDCNVRCNSDGYLEVLVDDVWKQSDLQAISVENVDYIYNKGASYVALDTTSTIVPAPSHTFVPPIVNADNIALTVTTGYKSCAFSTKAKYDLTNYNSLFALVEWEGVEHELFIDISSVTGSYYVNIGLHTSAKSYLQLRVSTALNGTDNNTIAVDIETLETINTTAYVKSLFVK